MIQSLRNHTCSMCVLTSILASLVIVSLSSHTVYAESSSTSTSSTTVASFVFNKNLSLGSDVNPDVQNLQRILNENISTRVADTGPGSKDSLTSYFGTKTKEAVIRFQNVYRADILTPLGLTYGNGVVGPATRKKLNQITTVDSPTSHLLYVSYAGNTALNKPAQTSTIVGDQTASTTYKLFFAPPQATSTTGSTLVGSLKIAGLSTYHALPGQVVSIFGQGFTFIDNTVYVGNIKAGVYSASSNKDSVTFTVPLVPTVGVYQLAVSNIYGTLNSGSIALAVDATQPPSNIVVEGGESTTSTAVASSTKPTTSPTKSTVTTTTYTKTTVVSTPPRIYTPSIPLINTTTNTGLPSSMTAGQTFFNIINTNTISGTTSSPNTFFQLQF